mmetsp:Transcript_25705/g.39527  ORF Transcript_25705/g.39527 Transcript_25705/m.39527 type:complete len:107 (+) Transcript_25705:863-1183(+)
MEFNVFKTNPNAQQLRKHSTHAQRRVEEEFSKPMGADRSPSTVDQLYFRGGTNNRTIPVNRSQHSQNSGQRLFGADVTNTRSPTKKAGKRHFQPSYSEQNLMGVLH